MNTNYNYIANLLAEIANGHPQLQDVRLSFKDQRSLFHEKAKALPVLYANVTNMTYLEYTINWDIDIYVMDNLLDNRQNEQSIMTSTGEIINHIINFVKNEKFNDYRFLDIGIAEPLNNYDNNRMNGWIFRTKIETKRGQCYTPIQSGIVPILCEDANYLVQYDNGTLIQQGTIPSGGSVTVNVPDPSVCDSASWELRDSNGVLLDSGTIASGGSATITAPDATFSINNTQVATIPSGGSDSIEVRQEQGATEIGSLQGQHWRVDDSPITVDGASFESLPATDSLDINLVDQDGNTITPLSLSSPTIEVDIPKDLTLLLPYSSGDTSTEITVITDSDGTITTATTTGLTSVVYELNASVVTLPFTLSVSDILIISFDSAAADGTIKLEGSYV